MYMLLLLLFNVLIVFVRCYNVDFEYAVAKSGPSNSYFGFSVAEHYDGNEKWILVGAPKANNSGLISKYQESGTVFKCRPNDPVSSCTEEVLFDTSVRLRNENKSNEWLGVSLRSGGRYQDVVTCAHRYEFQGLNKNFRLLEGQCYVIDKNLKRKILVSSPCNSENTRTSGTSDHTSYGQCQSGIGLDIMPGVYRKEDDELTPVAIGAAGTKWWSGELFQTDSEKKSKGELPKKIQGDIQNKNEFGYRSSYFGYAVAYGNFIYPDVPHIASGGPRHKHFGKVLIYESKPFDKKLKLIQELENIAEQIQIASGYGIALCSIDSDKNGLAELIVGAPFFLSLEGKERPEQGIVYIYSKADGEDKLVEQGTIKGEAEYSTFGYAVANGSDINLDGFEDLIVGAPREDGGNGAVYIYFGSKDGLVQESRQRIKATDIHSGLTDNIGLKGFGRSLGTGVDMDDNGYNDVLVGAYLSNQVALLRSRPVIKVFSRLEFNPKQLDAGAGTCETSKVSTCTLVKLCFNISEPSGKLKLKNQAVLVKYIIEADPIRGSVRKSRMKFSDTGNKDNIKSFIANSTGQYKCQELGRVSLRDASVIEYPDIMFKVSYEIPYDEPAFVKPPRSDSKVVSLDDYPILQQNIGTTGGDKQDVFMTAQLKFKRNCTTCIPDLKLSSAQQHHTLRRKQKDKGQNYNFDINIENIGEDLAYSVNLEIKLPNGLTLNDYKLKNKNKNVACQKDTNICQNVISKLKRGESRNVTINLETGDFTLNYNPKGENNISIIVSSANEEAGTTSDNRVAISFDLKVDADLRLYTTHSESLPYEGEVKGETAMKTFKDAGDIVRHKYVVTNDGPDMLEKAILTIDWPYQTKYGKHLLYLVKLEGVDAMKDVECEQSIFNILGLREGPSHLTEVPPSPKHTHDPEKSKTVTNKRVRREINNLPKTAAASKKKGTVLNCNNSQCMQIKCTITNMVKDTPRTITVKSVLWEPSLLLDYPGEELSIVSRGRVVIGQNASYIIDPNPYNEDQEVFTVVTPIIPQKRKEKIAVWQIALAVAAGVILLGLMIFGLYKVGFFRRTRRQDDSNGADESLIKGGRH